MFVIFAARWLTRLWLLYYVFVCLELGLKFESTRDYKQVIFIIKM